MRTVVALAVASAAWIAAAGSWSASTWAERRATVDRGLQQGLADCRGRYGGGDRLDRCADLFRVIHQEQVNAMVLNAVLLAAMPPLVLAAGVAVGRRMRQG